MQVNPRIFLFLSLFFHFFFSLSSFSLFLSFSLFPYLSFIVFVFDLPSISLNLTPLTISFSFSFVHLSTFSRALWIPMDTFYFHSVIHTYENSVHSREFIQRFCSFVCYDAALFWLLCSLNSPRYELNVN